MLDTLLVFDIETLPDVNSCKNLLNIRGDSSVEENRDALTKYHLEITNGQNSFLRRPFHQIVVCNISHQSGYEVFTLQEIRSGGTLNCSEKELVKGFFNYISEKKPRLVSFKRRTFDIPVLKYRAMIHSIQAEYFQKLALSGIVTIRDIAVIGIVICLKLSLIFELLRE